MLTIDHIVEKFSSLGSEKEFVANRRRYGTPAAAIKKALEQRRVHMPTEAEREQQNERFQADLISQPRHEQINRYLWLFGSHERAIPLWEATIEEPADVFWKV